MLSTLGIVLGTASLIGILSVSDGAQLFIQRQLEPGVQVVSVLPRTSDVVDGLSIARATYPVFTISHARALSARLGAGSPVALSAAGTGMFQLAQVGTGRAATVTGIYGSLSAMPGSPRIAHGRFLAQDEMEVAAGVAVISHNLAALIAVGKPLSDVVNIPLLLQGQQWRIVGIFDAVPGERTFNVMVPIGALPLATVTSQLPRPASLSVRAPRAEGVLDLQRQIEAWADATNRQWLEGNQITVSSQSAIRLRQFNQVMLVFRLVMSSFAVISLVVGGVGIMNVLLAAVGERTREIGVRKAAGARRTDITAQFLSESLTISVAGALIGAVAGFWAAVGISAFIRFRTSAPLHAAFRWQSFGASMAAAVAVGVIFGIYPAVKAAYLSPIDAMRCE